MNMNVAASVMPVTMGTDEDLVSGKTSLGEFHSKLMSMRRIKQSFFLIFWIKAQDVMMRLDIIVILVFVILPVQHLTFLIEIKRSAVDSVQDERISHDEISIRIPQRSSISVMLEHQILNGLSIVGTFTCEMF